MGLGSRRYSRTFKWEHLHNASVEGLEAGF